MPAKSARTPSRGRPPKRSAGTSSAGRSQSASRRSRSAANKAFKQIHQQQHKRPAKEAKSPAKTPKPTKVKRKETPSRKVATAPAAYSAASKRARSRGSISPTRAPRPVTTTTVSSVRGTPHVSALGVSTTTGGRTSRGSLSPPALRSRTFAQHVAQQHAQLMRQIDAQQKSPKAKAAKQKPWPIVQAVRDAPSALSHQFSKLGRNLKRGPRPMLRRTGTHLRRNWKYWLLLLAVVLLAGLLYKFQREVIANVQQINKQMVDFIGEQYEQKRRIFG